MVEKIKSKNWVQSFELKYKETHLNLKPLLKLIVHLKPWHCKQSIKYYTPKVFFSNNISYLYLTSYELANFKTGTILRVWSLNKELFMELN